MRLLEMVGRLSVELHPGRRRQATLDSHLERDLGLDSLGRVELLARIEKTFGVALPEHVFAEVETPRDLLRALASAGGAGVSPITTGQHAPALPGMAGVPDQAQTLIDVLRWHVERHADRLHVQLYDESGEGARITYGELLAGAESMAIGLQQLGLGRGDKVALMLPTGLDYLRTFYGILLAGCVPVPIYPPARLSQIEEHIRRHRGILQNSLSTLLVTVPQAKAVGRLLKTAAPVLKHVLTPGDLKLGGTLQLPGIGPEDTAFLQYTSGSTGDPKGVVLTHANLLANIRAMGEAVNASADDIFVSWLPLYHDMGLIGAWLGSLYFGVLVVLMSPLEFLVRPQRWLHAIHYHRATLSASPNFGYELCLKRIAEDELGDIDLGSWRLAFNGAEPVSPDTLQRFHNRFARNGLRREALMPVYGLAENSVGVAFPPLGQGPRIMRIKRDIFMSEGEAVEAAESDEHAMLMVSCGQPLPGHEIRVVDENSRELPEGQEGHVQFRGPSATSGYYRNPEKTRSLFDGDWLQTGDMGYMAGGDLYISGREKDVIIRAGRNIYPQELEEAVGNIDGIRKGCVAVVAARDRTTATERLVVIAETRATDAVKLEQLRETIDSLTLDLMGVPCDEVVLAPPHAVLKTSSGKIRRAACRDAYEEGRLGGALPPVWMQLGHLLLDVLGPGLRRMRRSAAALLYASYAWTMFWLIAPPTWLLTALLPRVNWCWPFLRAMARLLGWLVAVPVKVSGMSNLPTGKPAVLVANHASYIDGIVLVSRFPEPVSFVAKGEFRPRLIPRVFLSRMGAEFVERLNHEQSAVDAGRLVKASRSGRPLLFFAEGTFTRVPGLRSFYMGAFVVAARNRLPVIPIAVRGTRSILRDGSWFPRRGKIHIVVGEPIDTAALAAASGGDDWLTAIALRERAREHILRHCGEPDLAAEHGRP